MKNRRKQNFEGEANNMQLDKEDTISYCGMKPE